MMVLYENIIWKYFSVERLLTLLLYMNSRNVMVMCYIIKFDLHIFVCLTISGLGVKK
jgi:hypothetical protein